jgi:integrase
MPVFSWMKFDNLYHTDRAAKEVIEKAYDEYIQILKEEERIGTASSYQCSINNLKFYQKEMKYQELKFRDITVDFLKKYDRWMKSEKYSDSTIGIYLRPLRAIFNKAILDGFLSREYYPFGKGRYEIPTSRNIKKALNKNQIKMIFDYKAVLGSNEEKWRDYWLFMYLCNGINVKDLCLLRYKDIKSQTIEYIRAKTARTKKVTEPITIALLPEIKKIINKWGNAREDVDTFIFPELQKGVTKEQERNLIQLLTRNINNKMAAIAQKLEFDVKITTYHARHSFGSILKKSGQSVEFIREALGHGDTRTTKSYLSSFDEEEKFEAAKALVNF